MCRGMLKDHCGSRTKPDPIWAAQRSQVPLPSAVQDAASPQAAALPAGAFELGSIVLVQRKAETEIADEAPLRGNLQQPGHARGIEDRDPAHSDALPPRRQP